MLAQFVFVGKIFEEYTDRGWARSYHMGWDRDETDKTIIFYARSSPNLEILANANL